MNLVGIIDEIDGEIARLQSVRASLHTILGGHSIEPRRGRPVGSINKVGKKPKRNLSPEGRQRIADAMKKRWATRRKEMAAKTPKKAAKKAAKKAVKSAKKKAVKKPSAPVVAAPTA